MLKAPYPHLGVTVPPQLCTIGVMMPMPRWRYHQLKFVLGVQADPDVFTIAIALYGPTRVTIVSECIRQGTSKSVKVDQLPTLSFVAPSSTQKAST